MILGRYESCKSVVPSPLYFRGVGAASGWQRWMASKRSVRGCCASVAGIGWHGGGLTLASLLWRVMAGMVRHVWPVMARAWWAVRSSRKAALWQVTCCDHGAGYAARVLGG